MLFLIARKKTSKIALASLIAIVILIAGKIESLAESSPGCFDLLSPANGSIVSSTPMLSWQSSPGAIVYDLRIYTGSCCVNTYAYTINDITSTSYKVPSGYLKPGQTYYWAISARNDYGWMWSNNCSKSCYEACWSFAVKSRKPIENSMIKKQCNFVRALDLTKLEYGEIISFAGSYLIGETAEASIAPVQTLFWEINDDMEEGSTIHLKIDITKLSSLGGKITSVPELSILGCDEGSIIIDSGIATKSFSCSVRVQRCENLGQGQGCYANKRKCFFFSVQRTGNLGAGIAHGFKAKVLYEGME